MKLEEIIEAVEGMSFYLDDVPTILKMLEYLSPEEFTKCLEEILMGNLFFSDFKDIFNETDYSRNLETTFEQQYELSQRITAIKAIRQDMLAYNNEITGELQDIEYFKKYNLDDPTKNKMGIERSVASANEKMEKLYDTYEDRLRQNLLYTLTHINVGDSILTKQYKAKLYKELNDPQSKYSVRDIFFFIQNYILPVDPESQILTDVDRKFMIENDVDAETMRQLKAATIFLQQKNSE